jgi:pyrimidine-specific ribonucleoside hydrolase
VCLVLLLVLVVAGGPLLVRLGVEPFYIESDGSHIRLVRPTPDPASLPALEPGPAPALAAGARPVIVDTDMAADDWMAILYLLQRPDLDLRAITVTGTGEAHCGPGVRNALDLAALAGRPEVPVACGRETPLAGNHAFPTSWRERVDDLLGLSLPTNPNALFAGSAVELLSRAIRESPRKVEIVALGPLTNVAEALEADPALVDRLQRITIMGGAVDEPGNVGFSGIRNTAAEWNIYVDPHAAAIVLRSGAPITLVPLDATQVVPVTASFYKEMKRRRQTPAAEFVYRVLTQKQGDIGSGLYCFWDPFTAAVITDEGLGVWQELTLAVIEEEGPNSGRTLVDGNGYPARVAMGADAARFEAVFLNTLNGASGGF